MSNFGEGIIYQYVSQSWISLSVSIFQLANLYNSSALCTAMQPYLVSGRYLNSYKKNNHASKRTKNIHL
jgi:hypothetical protein